MANRNGRGGRNSNNNDKIWLGYGEERDSKFGQLISMYFKKEHVEEMLDWIEDNDDKGVKVTIAELKEESEYGSTHNSWIDEWKPDNKDNGGGRSNGRGGRNNRRGK